MIAFRIARAEFENQRPYIEPVKRRDDEPKNSGSLGKRNKQVGN
jgi:hypothetical protein